MEKMKLLFFFFFLNSARDGRRNRGEGDGAKSTDDLDHLASVDLLFFVHFKK